MPSDDTLKTGKSVKLSGGVNLRLNKPPREKTRKIAPNNATDCVAFLFQEEQCLRFRVAFCQNIAARDLDRSQRERGS